MSDARNIQGDLSRGSAISHLDPRTRLLIALLATLTLIGIDSLVLLSSAFVIALLTSIMAGLDASSVFRRMILLEGFVIVLLVILPFTTHGEPLFELGPVAPSEEGLNLALVIALKINAITLLNLTLIGSLLPQQVGYSLRSLRVPGNLVQLLLMSVRYIGVLENEYARIRRAMKSRAFLAGSNIHTWRTFGWMIGMLLVRSFERSRRVNNAMKCRGFNGSFNFHAATPLTVIDVLALTITTAISASFILWSQMA